MIATQTVRRANGATMILLVALIGLLVIPIIGIFVFECNRFQELQRQLEKIVDATALCGGRRLTEADVSGASGDINLVTQYRHWQAMNTAYAFITSQESAQPLHEINSIPLNPNQGTPGYLQPWFETTDPPSPVGPNTGVVQIIPCDPSNHYQPVVPGTRNGRALLVKAKYNIVPAFGKFLGIGYVPIFTSSGASYPNVDVLVCLDMSGSMDDCTRMTLVSETVQMAPSGLTNLMTLGPPPPYPDYTACAYNPAAGMCATTQLACEQPIYNTYYPLYDAWAASFVKNRDHGLMLAYLPVAQGRLRDIVKDAGAVITDAGTQINVCPLTHRYYLQGAYASNNTYNWLNGANTTLTAEVAPPTGDACGAATQTLGSSPAVAGGGALTVSASNSGATCTGNFWNWNPTTNTYTYNGTTGSGGKPKFGMQYPGFDLFIANLGPVCNSNAPQPKFGPLVAPAFTANPGDMSGNPAPFTYTDNGNSFLFDRLATIVEASEGNLETASGMQNKINNIEKAIFGTVSGTMYTNTITAIGGPLPSGAGYQQAYRDAAREVMQPYATAVSATQNFMDSLAGSGKNVRVGFVSFESYTESSVPSGAQPLPTPNTYQEAMVPDTPPAGVSPEPSEPIISVGLTDTTNTAAMAQLYKELHRTTPLDTTNMGQALTDAYNILQAGAVNRPGQKVIVMITDGINSAPAGAPDPITVVKGWTNTNIPVYCIGLNQLSTPAFIGEMQKELGDGNNGTGQGVSYWSGNGAEYYQAPNPLALTKALDSIGRRIMTLTQ
ncbi:MAG TPA: vWA domain-containing protein [Candidatus Obscuribacterales bacterium]